MRYDKNLFYPRRNPEWGVREDRRKFLETASISLNLPSLFYASLRDPDVFNAVVGRPMDDCHWEIALLDGVRLAEVNVGTGYPGIFPAETGHRSRLECLVVHDLTRFEQTMIAWYEWDEYVLNRATLTDGRIVQVFVPELDAIHREHGAFEVRPWSFEDWQFRCKERAVATARAWMAQRPGDVELLEARCCPQEELPANRRAAG